MEVTAGRDRNAVKAQVANRNFELALTADFYNTAGKLKYRDIGLALLDADHTIVAQPMAEHHPEIGPEQLANVDAALVLAPRVTARSLERAERLLVVARFGVGYDNVDVAACTDHDVLLCITAGAVDRPVAEATLSWMLALSYRVAIKDRLVREARWDDRSQFMGSGLRGKTVGIVGMGGIGRELARLIAGFQMARPLVFDAHLSNEAVQERGGTPVSLDELLRDSDFVTLHCPLTPGTRNLIGARELSLMKGTAYLINTARGGIVDEEALYAALQERRIAGAALDCFVGEPLQAAPRFAELDNVLLAPHSIAWTNELFEDIGRTAIQSILDVRSGRRPHGMVNPEVLERAGFQAKQHATMA
jgi:phosphoglycerate dehydrogenase-like enzyme